MVKENDKCGTIVLQRLFEQLQYVFWDTVGISLQIRFYRPENPMYQHLKLIISN